MTSTTQISLLLQSNKVQSLKFFKKQLATIRGDIITAFQYFQVIRFISNVLLSIFLVKSTLTVTEIGFFEVLLFIVQILTMFWLTGFTQAFISRFHAESPIQQLNLVRMCTGIIFLLGLIFSGILLLVQGGIAELVPQFADLPRLELLAMFIVLNTPTIMIEHILLVKAKPKALEQYAHVSFGLYLTGMGVMLYFLPSVANIMMVLIMWAAAKLVYLIILMEGNIVFKWEKERVQAFVGYSIPLIVAALLGVSMDYVDQLLVMFYFGPEEFPVFRYGARELPFALLLLSALSNAMIPVLVKEGTAGTQLRIRTTRLMHWLFPAAFLMMFVSPHLFVMVYDENFAASAYIFNIYLLILISRVLLPQSYNFALQQNKVIMFSGIAELLVNLFLSLWWVEIWGIYGLAMATVVAYLIQKIILVVYNLKVNNIRPGQYIDVKWYLIYSFMLIVAFFVNFKTTMPG
jgi:O-antigen/teichoic acid export membrane protein